MKNCYWILIIFWITIFITPQASSSDTYTKIWDGVDYDSIGGSYRDPDPANGAKWICLSHDLFNPGVAGYKLDHTALIFPGLYKYTVKVNGYDDGGGARTTKFGLVDFVADEVVYFGSLFTSEKWASGSVTSSLGRFSNAADEIWVIIYSLPDQHGHIGSVKLEIEYNCYPPGVPGAPETYSGTPCSQQDFYVRWNSVAEATKYRLYEDGVQIYEGADTATYPPDFYQRPAGTYSYRVSAGNEYGWSAQGPEYLAEVLQGAGEIENLFFSPENQCEDEPFELSWNSTSDTWRYTVYFVDELYVPFIVYGHVYHPDTSIEISLPNGTFYFMVKAENSNGCSEGNGPVESIDVNPKPDAPTWITNNLYNICQYGVYYPRWNFVSGATQYRVYENDVIVGVFGSETNRISRVKYEGGEWKYLVQAMVENCWSENSDTLTITTTYDPPPPKPAQPSISPAVICPGSTYTVSWSAMTDIVTYKLIESGTVVYQGTELSTEFTNGPGNYEYYLQVSNGDCYSFFGDKLNVDIPATVEKPDTLVVPDYIIQIDELYTVSWSKDAGAAWYYLYENWGLIYNGPDSQVTLSHNTENNFIYEVIACNDCGCSEAIEAGPVQVMAVTDIHETDSDVLPDNFALSQNYPNPFNPVTQIDFSLPRASHVNIEVYNILGSRINTLVNKRLSPGYKSIEWDGNNESGRSMPSGVYLFRITTGEFTATCKGILIK